MSNLPRFARSAPGCHSRAMRIRGPFVVVWCALAAACPSATTPPAGTDAAVARDAAPPDSALDSTSDAAPTRDAAELEDDAALDAGPSAADAEPTPTDAGTPPSGAWQVASTEQGGADPATIQRLRVATNARGDAALLWELYPDKLKGTTYSAATGIWSPVVTLERAGWTLGLPAVQVLEDGTALAVWREFDRAGTTLRLGTARARGGVWGAPEVLATLSGSVQADISPPQLLADGRGRAAVSWQQLRVGSGASQGFVATSTGGRWRVEQAGLDYESPVRIALDGTGAVHALYAGRIAPNAPSNSLIHRRYSFADDTWHAPTVVVDTPTLYPCSNDSVACYALAATRTGEVVVLGWDAVGSFSGQGTLRAYVRSVAGDTWSAGEVLGTDTTPPIVQGYGSGVRAVYGTLDAARAPQLESRRWTRAGGWAAPERLAGFVARALAVSDDGDAVAVGTTQGVTPASTLSTVNAWSAPELYEDLSACVGRDTVGVLDDVGSLLVAQICLSPGGNFPFFVRARRSVY
jgi:hypothetical protein